jgi:threonine/homoserine/homoserine lactone efflux protein
MPGPTLTEWKMRAQTTRAKSGIVINSARHLEEDAAPTMPLHLYLAFIAASVILILMPGPNVAVIVTSSISRGPRYGLLAVAGTSSAMVIQLSVVVLGISGALSLFAHWFEWFRWLGVFYLFYLGVQAWRLPANSRIQAARQEKTPRQIYMRGFLVSLTNPKTLLFYGAFLPQFVGQSENRTTQLLILAATFLVVAVCLDSLWALGTSWLQRKIKIQSRLWSRITGATLFSAAGALALAQRP